MLNQKVPDSNKDRVSAGKVGSSFQLLKKKAGGWLPLANVDLASLLKDGHFSPMLTREQADSMFKNVVKRQERNDMMSNIQGSFIDKEYQRDANLRVLERKRMLRDEDRRVWYEPSSKFCSVCKTDFAKYSQHLNHPLHKSKISNDPRNKDILQFIRNDTLVMEVCKNKKENPEQIWDKVSRRPELAEHQKEQIDMEMGKPRKRKPKTQNFVSSTNIFSSSAALPLS